MNTYNDYIQEIEERKGQGLHPKPIDGAELLSEIIAQIKDLSNANRVDSLNFFIYNVNDRFLNYFQNQKVTILVFLFVMQT